MKPILGLVCQLPWCLRSWAKLPGYFLKSVETKLLIPAKSGISITPEV